MKIPQPLRTYTNGEPLLELKGATVRELLNDLSVHYPALHPHLFTKKGELAAFVHLFVKDEDIRTKWGLETPLSPDDIVILVPSIAGG